MLEGMHIFKDCTGASSFELYGPDDRPTGKYISYLFERRNGQDFSFGFDPDMPDALEAAAAEFERFLELNGGKVIPDA